MMIETLLVGAAIFAAGAWFGYEVGRAARSSRALLPTPQREEKPGPSRFGIKRQ